MRKVLKKILRCVGIAVAALMALVVLAVVLIYLPPVQNYVVDKVAAYASEQTGMDISIGHVCLKFPLDLGIEGVTVTKPDTDHPQLTDTIAAIDELVVDVRLLPLLRLDVEVDALELNGVRMNTADLIAAARIEGEVGRLYAASHGIDLGAETVRVDIAEIEDADVSVTLLNDTTAADTTTSENRWQIAVDSIDIRRTGLLLVMGGDTTQVSAGIDCLTAARADIDLGAGLYEVERVTWSGGTAAYDNSYEPRLDGLDYSHIEVSDVNIVIDSVSYRETGLRAVLSSCSMTEKSGLTITTLTTTLAMDTASLYLPDLELRTTASAVHGSIVMDLNAFDDEQPGVIDITADAAVGKSDLMLLAGGLPDAVARTWPDEPLTAAIVARGNLQTLDITMLNANLPGVVNADISGTVGNLADTDNLTADLSLTAQTYDMSIVTALAADGGDAGFTIPQGITLDGDVTIRGSRYAADMTAREGGGQLDLNADIDVSTMRYTAQVKSRSLQLNHYLPGMGLGALTASIDLKGHGTDITAKSTAMTLDATIDDFSVGSYSFDNISLDATLAGGVAAVTLDSDNDLLLGRVTVDALTSQKIMKATVSADITNADLYNLMLTDSPMRIALCCHLDAASDLDEYHAAQGSIGDITLRAGEQVFRPADINIDALTSRDTTYAQLTTGDFDLDFTLGGGYNWLLQCIDNITTKISDDLNDRKIEYAALREMLPVMSLEMHSGQDNAISRFLAYSGLSFSQADIDLRFSPEQGLNGRLYARDVRSDSIMVDTLKLSITSTQTTLRYNMSACNTADRNDERKPAFRAYLDGEIQERGLSTRLTFYDRDDLLALRLGIDGTVEDNGIRVSMMTDKTVIGYKTFAVNDDNYVFLANDRRISADLSLTADDGQGLALNSNDDNSDALQDLTLSVQRIDLGPIMSALPFLPDVTGILDGDVNVILTDDNNLSVAASLSVDDLVYEGCAMGDIAADIAYMPLDDGSHSVDGTIMSDGHKVATINGTYNPEGDGFIDADLTTNRFPLAMVNGFIPDQIVGFRGYCNGDVDIKGSLATPQINGQLTLDSCYLFSTPYGIELRFSDQPLTISDSRLNFEQYNLYANNDNPLTINGNVSFADLENMSMDMTIRAKDFLLIDAKESEGSIAYGKAFVNFFGMLDGPLSAISLKGRLEVLATTDVTYVLTDTPLSSDNQMEGLVTFIDFTDTVPVAVTRPTLEGFSMDLSVVIDDGTHAMCYLNSDHSNYVDFMGGGDLKLGMGATGDMTLEGDINIKQGELKYSLPVIPLKTFTIQDGSYIKFTGEAMNPTLNITATESVKTTVSTDGSDGRLVEFDCGVIITQTLSDMGLEFTLDAPEDLTVHSELQQMGPEQRGKLAVTMLTTGMYLADGNTSGFTMNNALSAFLQSEISNITGNALRTLDLSFGIDNATDAGGNTHTDYSFKFAKRFWNNRLNVIIGGKVSSGTENNDRNESFLDNVTLEYRLDNTANKYVTLFYDNNVYDWLEGNTQEYGVGFIWRRSLQHFRDIFKLKSTTDQPKAAPATTEPADTTNVKTADDE